ncbi:ATP:cob(I)alamin adenosyltransferase, partial [Ostertagia ostertagi]
MQLIADLKARGLIQDIMPGTEEQLQKEMTAGYIGFDPTADSLHVGSLLPITLLMRLQRAGHKPIALVGGATGMIGDPTGKSAERNMLDMDTLQKNCDGIRKQLEKFLDFDDTKPNAAEMVNNYDWLKDYTFLDFIRDIGKHITVNYMLSKDSVQKRMEHGFYGTIDELNSYLGMVNDSCGNPEISDWLREIQDRLFTLGAELATTPDKEVKMKLPDLHDEDVSWLEQRIDKMNEVLPEMRSFIIPGGNMAASTCHVARCVCRRAERLCVGMQQQEEYVPDLIVRYLNRLSDFLFVLA